jgi:hypothetical protein
VWDSAEWLTKRKPVKTQRAKKQKQKISGKLFPRFKNIVNFISLLSLLFLLYLLSLLSPGLTIFFSVFFVAFLF